MTQLFRSIIVKESLHILLIYHGKSLLMLNLLSNYQFPNSNFPNFNYFFQISKKNVQISNFFLNFRILTNPNSKSKVKVEVWADDWVFIKIRFSNQSPTQPASRESFKEARCINISKTKFVSIYHVLE